MNKLSTFSQLTTRVAEIGYTVNKVTPTEKCNFARFLVRSCVCNSTKKSPNPIYAGCVPRVPR